MSSLAPLATVQDVQARMPRTLTAADNARVNALLADASNLVRAFARQKFTVDTTQRVFRPVDNQIVLQERPVISVDSLARVGPDGKTMMPFSIWTFDGIATIMLGPPSMLINAPEVWTDVDWFWRNVTYMVGYTHGYTVIPEDVVGVVANMACRVLLAPGAPGMVTETIGGYSYRMADGFPTAMVSLTAEDRETLSAYRARRNRTVELR